MTRLVWQATLLVVLLVWAGSPAVADTILDFEPNPSSPSLAEVTWNGTTLREGSGSVSNGDGNLGAGGTAPGLLLSVPFFIPGVPGSQISGATTTFFDSTFDIVTGFTTPPGIAGNAINAGGLLIQPLGSGTFEVRSSNIASGNQVLLTGTVDDATITGLNGTHTGAVLSATVTYTGGLIYNAMIANNFDPLGGAMSWSMVSITPGLAIDNTTHHLKSFNADMTGLFSAEVISVPEPSTLALLGLAAVTLRRRHR